MSTKSKTEDRVADLDAKIGMLVELGFSVDQANEALEMNDGNVDGAIKTLLLSGQESSEGKTGNCLMEADTIVDEGETSAGNVTDNHEGVRRRHLSSDTASRGSRLRQHDDCIDVEIAEPNAEHAEYPGVTHEASLDRHSTRSLDTVNVTDETTSALSNQVVDTTANQSSHNTVYPGAYAVAGIDAHETDGDEYTTMAPASVASLPFEVEARLVQGNEEDVEELQEELQQRNEELQQRNEELQQRNEELRQRDLELEHLRRAQENVVMAEVLPTDDEENPPTPTDREEQNDLPDDNDDSSPKSSWLKCPRVKWILIGNSLDDNASYAPSIKRWKLVVGGCIAIVVVVGFIIGMVVAVTRCSSLTCVLRGKSYDSEKLELNNNGLTGKIPSEIALYTKLNELRLDNNEFTGSIPPEIGLLTNLKYLYLDNNELAGKIPSEIALMPNLMTLSLSRNELTGTIPTDIAQMENLYWLSLSDNKLTGTIPTEIALMTNLKYLYLYENELTGTILSEIALMTDLFGLYLYNNTLTGTIPTEIALMTDLSRLYLYNNELMGKIPTEIALMTNLKYLSLENNAFSGNFTCPDFILYCFISCDDLETHDLNSTCRTL